MRRFAWACVVVYNLRLLPNWLFLVGGHLNHFLLNFSVSELFLTASNCNLHQNPDSSNSPCSLNAIQKKHFVPSTIEISFAIVHNEFHINGQKIKVARIHFVKILLEIIHSWLLLASIIPDLLSVTHFYFCYFILLLIFIFLFASLRPELNFNATPITCNNLFSGGSWRGKMGAGICLF